MKERHLNKLMLAFSIIGGIIGYVIGEVLINFFTYRISNVLLVGIYFAVFSLCITIMCFIAESISPKLTNSLWRTDNIKINMFVIIPLVVIAMFASGCFAQFIYGLSGKNDSKPQFDDYIFLMDNSGSMASSDPDDLRIAQIDQIIDELDSSKRIAYYSFGSDTDRAFDLQYVNEGVKQKMHDAIRNTKSNGGTDIRNALVTALEDVKPRLKADRATSLVLVSDGIDYFDTDAIVQDCIKNNVVIDCVGLGIDMFNSGELMSRLADGTGGNFYDIQSADQIIGVFTNIKENGTSSRFLLSRRYGTERTNWVYGLERVLFITLFGVLLSLGLGFLFDNRQLIKNLLIGGTVTGVLAGLAMELGFYFYINTRYCRISMDILLSIVVCMFTAIIAYDVTEGISSNRNRYNAFDGIGLQTGNESNNYKLQF